MPFKNSLLHLKWESGDGEGRHIEGRGMQLRAEWISFLFKVIETQWRVFFCADAPLPPFESPLPLPESLWPFPCEKSISMTWGTGCDTVGLPSASLTKSLQTATNLLDLSREIDLPIYRDIWFDDIVLIQNADMIFNYCWLSFSILLLFTNQTLVGTMSLFEQLYTTISTRSQNSAQLFSQPRGFCYSQTCTT